MSEHIHPTAIVHPTSQIGKNVTIGPYSIIQENTVLGDDTVILNHVTIAKKTVLGRGNVIHMGAVLGHDPQSTQEAKADSFVQIGDRNIFREYVTVHRGLASGPSTMIGNDSLFMALCHIAHDCIIGNFVTIANAALLGGHVEIEDHAFLSGIVGVHQFCRIGRYAMIGGHTGISRDVPPYMLVDKNEGLIGSINIVGLRRAGFSEAVHRDIKNAYKILYRSGLNVSNAVEAITAKCHSKEVAHLVEFVKKSKRGILAHRRGRTPTIDSPIKIGTAY